MNHQSFDIGRVWFYSWPDSTTHSTTLHAKVIDANAYAGTILLEAIDGPPDGIQISFEYDFAGVLSSISHGFYNEYQKRSGAEQ